MITFTITERQARYIRFAVQSDAAVLNNGDFEEPDDKVQQVDAAAILAVIDAALLAGARR